MGYAGELPPGFFFKIKQLTIMNTYSKFCPNVYLAKCEPQYEKGETILVKTKYGKENECIVFNLIYSRDGFHFYSIVRADGFNQQEWAKRRAERLNAAAANAEKRSDAYWAAADEGKDFLSLGEPIKVGHHSEKRHRALIARNHARMDNSIKEQKKAEGDAERASYWEGRTEIINLSMPESIEYYEFVLEGAQARHAGLKDGTIPREHSFSLAYANKDVREAEKNLELAQRLWG